MTKRRILRLNSNNNSKMNYILDIIQAKLTQKIEKRYYLQYNTINK